MIRRFPIIASAFLSLLLTACGGGESENFFTSGRFTEVLLEYPHSLDGTVVGTADSYTLEFTMGGTTVAFDSPVGPDDDSESVFITLAGQGVFETLLTNGSSDDMHVQTHIAGRTNVATESDTNPLNIQSTVLAGPDLIGATAITTIEYVVQSVDLATANGMTTHRIVGLIRIHGLPD